MQAHKLSATSFGSLNIFTRDKYRNAVKNKTCTYSVPQLIHFSLLLSLEWMKTAIHKKQQSLEQSSLLLFYSIFSIYLHEQKQHRTILKNLCLKLV